MKKSHLSLFVIISIVMLFSSCDKTETFDDKWKLDNEAQFAQITRDTDYTKINSQSGNGFIMYKEIQEGNGETPFFTDKVKVLYTGWYKREWSKPDSYTDDKNNIIYNKVIFDTTSNNNIARTLTVNGVVDGFSTALQNMQTGDKWEVWIPWKLGYGESGSGSIQGYSTLVFEIELVAITE